MAHEDDRIPAHVHSADFFGESREHWWNADYLALLRFALAGGLVGIVVCATKPA